MTETKLGKDFAALWVKQTPQNIMAIPHIHHFYEIYYILHGTCRFIIEGHTLDVTPGRLLVISPFVSHISIMRSPNLERFIIELPRETLAKPLHALGFPSIVDMVKFKWIILDSGDPVYRQSLLKSVHEEYISKELHHEARICLLLSDLLIYICRNAETSGICGEETTIPKNDTISQVAAYLAARFTEHLKLEDIAEEFHMEKTYLCKVFKKTLGLTIWEYLTMLRVQVACTMLITGDDRIIDIAHASGFGSVAHFERMLKKHTGYSPTAFRKQNFSE